MPHQAKAVLWVDDEAELLEPHRMFLRDKGFEVETATNADDAAELVRRRPFDLVLLDEQMPGTRGLESLKELREIDPNLQIVMVTKSEEDSTLTEALGKDIAGYLVKPITPRQVYALVARFLEGPRIRQQAIARSFVDRFRAMQNESLRELDWRGWIDRYLEVVSGTGPHVATRWGCTSRCGPVPDCGAVRAVHVDGVPGLDGPLEGDAALSIDIVGEFLMPWSSRNERGVHRHRLPSPRPVEGARARDRAAVRHRDDALLRHPAHGDAVCAQRAVQRPLSQRDRRALPRLVGRAGRRDAQCARARAARGAARGAQAQGPRQVRQDLLVD